MAYERWSFKKGSNIRALTEKKNWCFEYVVTPGGGGGGGGGTPHMKGVGMLVGNFELNP